MDKKIYLVVTAFFPTAESFRGPYVYDQVKAIMETGQYKVVVLMAVPWYHKGKDYEYDGVHVYCFTLYELPSRAWPGSGACLSLHSFDSCLKRIGIDYNDIAVVHAHVTGNALFANHVKEYNLSVKTVLQHHGYDVLSLTDGRFSNKEWHKKRTIEYGIQLCNKIDLHLGVSNEILKYLKSYDGIKLKDTYVLYNGVDLQKFYPDENRKQNNVFIIGCVANFLELKDQITLIRAVELLITEGYKDIRVSFVGSGYTREMCEEYVVEHKLSPYFEFKSEVDHRFLNAYYNTLDLFVLPSYWDAFGCVYTEAYACGVPFMVAKGSGITEYIIEEDFDKWVIEPHDYERLSKNIMYYIETRIVQKLKYPVDINELQSHYLSYLLNM